MTSYRSRNLPTPIAITPDDVPLFEQVGADDYECTRCGAVNAIEAQDWPSYGGTTEGYVKCTACGATESTADLSAVI